MKYAIFWELICLKKDKKRGDGANVNIAGCIEVEWNNGPKNHEI